MTLDTAKPGLTFIEKKLTKISISKWPEIRNQYTAQLADLKWEINNILREPNIRANNQILIGFRDRMNFRLFDGIEILNDRTLVTERFNEFMKGITCFQGDTAVDTEPLYHRDTSCPPKDRSNLRCASLSDPIKDRIYKCYVERLIYDELWIQMMTSQQNGPHLSWLNDTKTAFKTCFPDVEINVSLIIEHDRPTSVSIKKLEGSTTTVEIYGRRYYPSLNKYDPLIMGILTKNGETIAMKTNVYEHEGTWKMMPLHVGGGGKESLSICNTFSECLKDLKDLQYI